MTPLYSAVIKMVTLLQKRYVVLLYKTTKAEISNKVQEEIDAHQQIQFHTVSSNLYKDDGASARAFFLLRFDNASSMCGLHQSVAQLKWSQSIQSYLIQNARTNHW